jgi:hypothetical protein
MGQRILKKEVNMDSSKALSALYTVVLVFLATFISVLLANGFDVFNIDIGTLEAAAAAGMTAVLTLIVNFINPKVTRYGVGS